MQSIRTVSAVDSHTEGMPTRVITGGIGPIPGDTMAARRHYFINHLGHVRQWLMHEPRRHAAMSGAILQLQRGRTPTGACYSSRCRDV